jgi:ABC-2 type transport system permease protein
MSTKRVAAIARRVMRQIARDHRTVALLILAPMLMLTLGAILFRAKPAAIAVGVVNEDQGLTAPLTGKLVLGQRIVDGLTVSDTFKVVPLRTDESDARLRDGTVKGVLVLPSDLTAQVLSGQRVTLDLRLEGSNPSRSAVIIARVTQSAIRALASLGTAELAARGGGQARGGDASLPVTLAATYLFAGSEFDAMDYVAPVYIAFLALFFVFLLTCVSFLRERSQGTMERLMATPATRLEVVVGYMLGLGLFALIQVAVILFFTVWVLRIHYLGSLSLVFVVIALLTVVGVSLGILASAFARNEFQVVQFIPLVIIPQFLLGGTVWAIEDMPGYLQPIAHAMPITYANRALRDVMLKGWGLPEIWPNLLVLLGFSAVLIILGALTMRREGA